MSRVYLIFCKCCGKLRLSEHVFYDNVCKGSLCSICVAERDYSSCKAIPCSNECKMIIEHYCKLSGSKLKSCKCCGKFRVPEFFSLAGYTAKCCNDSPCFICVEGRNCSSCKELLILCSTECRTIIERYCRPLTIIERYYRLSRLKARG